MGFMAHAPVKLVLTQFHRAGKAACPVELGPPWGFNWGKERKEIKNYNMLYSLSEA